MLNKKKYATLFSSIKFSYIGQRISGVLTILFIFILTCWIKTVTAEQTQSSVHSLTYHAHSTHPLRKKISHRIIKNNAASMNKLTPSVSTIASKKLVKFIDDAVYNLNYSSYKLGGERFDTNKGIYIIDCSRFVDSILKKTYPHAYSNLVNATGTSTPTTQHYYNFFNKLPEKPKKHIYWNYIEQIKQLRPGDILVFRYKNLTGRKTAGHMMVIMNKPIRTSSHTFLVRVADSAPIRHSEDTRLRHESGIGIGTLLLKLNPLTGKPTAYAWEKGGAWKHNVKFAMARPLKFNV